jgi:hypothetical protein
MRNRQLAAAGSALVLAHDAGYFERSLLPEMVGGSEGIGAEVVYRRHALAHSSAVANQQEMDLAARTPVVEPSLERDFRPDMAAQILDIDPRHAFEFRRLRPDYRASTLRSVGCSMG